MTNAEPTPYDLATALPQAEWPMTPDKPTADPVQTEPAPVGVETPHRPSWHNLEPAIVHSVKWRDTEDCEHLHVVRADTLDEALIAVRELKACITAARAQSQTPASTLQTGLEQNLSSRCCELHDAPVLKIVNKRSGKPYNNHPPTGGEWCFGQPKG